MKLLGDSLRVERNENVAQFSRRHRSESSPRPLRGCHRRNRHLCAVPRAAPGRSFLPRGEALYAAFGSVFLPARLVRWSVTFHVIGQADSRFPRKPEPREFLAGRPPGSGRGAAAGRRRMRPSSGNTRPTGSGDPPALSCRTPDWLPPRSLTAAKALAGTPTLQRNLLKVRFDALGSAAAGSPWGGSLALRPDVRRQQ